MFALIRRNRHPTRLRHLVKALYKSVPPRSPVAGRMPSHHILCAGTYSPVFARLAAESALAACPPELRADFRLFIHVDGVAGRARTELMSWLSEIPGVELTYGLFGILSRDRIPGKWHQVMINDIVEEFSDEPHLVFLDADFFLLDRAWFDLLSAHLGESVYSVSVGTRSFARFKLGEVEHQAIKTQLFSVNTSLHRRLNLQRSSQDQSAFDSLEKEFPDIHFVIERPDSMISASLRAQALGYRVVNVLDQVAHCHVGGFSHLAYNKFHDYDKPERRVIIVDLVGRARLLSAVLRFFDGCGWGRFVDEKYRANEARMRSFIQSHHTLLELSKTTPPTSNEQAFHELVRRRS